MQARALLIALCIASTALGCGPGKEPAVSAGHPAPAPIEPEAPPKPEAPAAEAPVARDETLPQDRPLFVFVHADWCGPCRRAAPTVAVLRSEYSGRVAFVDLDITDDDATAKAAASADRLGIGPFFEANEGKTGVTILGSGRKPVRHLFGESQPTPYRRALDEAFASFKGKVR